MKTSPLSHMGRTGTAIVATVMAVPASSSSGLIRVLTGSVLFVLVAAGCGGQDRVDSFPQHDERIPPDSGREFFAGKLVLKEGCLRVDAPPPDSSYPESLLVIWPRSFTLITEDGPVRVVDAVGRIAARVGDHVRFGGYPSGPQTVRLRELGKELRTGCPGTLPVGRR